MSADPLGNYRQLRAQVEGLCQRIEREQAAHLACRRGCDGCCRHLRLFAVEAAALRAALRQQTPQRQALIRTRAAAAAASDPCPLLADGACLLYEARPIICRTHGLPLLVDAGGTGRVDYCPLNFAGVASLPGDAVIDLERLNTVLVAINRRYEAESGTGGGTGRLLMAEALR